MYPQLNQVPANDRKSRIRRIAQPVPVLDNDDPNDGWSELDMSTETATMGNGPLAKPPTAVVPFNSNNPKSTK